MKSQMAGRDKKAVIIAFATVLLVGLAANYLLGTTGLLFLLLAVGVLAIAVEIEVYRRISELLVNQTNLIGRDANQNYTQLESLFSVFSLIQPKGPLPQMRGWAVSPDFLNVMAGLLLECKPKLIVELGSGVSTLVAGYLQKEWGGRVLSFDHSEQFAERSKQEVHRHGLDDVVTVSWAPLEEVTLETQKYLWYEITKLRRCGPIDLLIIDGPPGSLQKLSRYPALPLLREELAPESVILLDDAGRDDELRIVELWKKMGDVDCEYVPTEKGTAILRRGVNARRERVASRPKTVFDN